MFCVKCVIIFILCGRYFTAYKCNFFLSQDLQDFLDMFYKACDVLQKEEDFYDLMYAYLKRASIDNVYVAETFFDPQTHTTRGIPFEVVINGLHRALVDGYRGHGSTVPD